MKLNGQKSRPTMAEKGIKNEKNWAIEAIVRGDTCELYK